MNRKLEKQFQCKEQLCLLKSDETLTCTQFGSLWKVLHFYVGTACCPSAKILLVRHARKTQGNSFSSPKLLLSLIDSATASSVSTEHLAFILSLIYKAVNISLDWELRKFAELGIEEWKRKRENFAWILV